MISELELDRAFAGQIENSINFQQWFLGKTKFSEQSDDLRLLHKEQANLKPKKKQENWWRHWWCKIEDGSESETDIFLVFENKESQQRIALHIEDKPPHGKFTPNQYLNYKKRAEFMKGKAEFMAYDDFATVLVSPKVFIERNQEEVANFDSIVTYEEVSEYIALFGDSINESNTK
ncbi:hypothetical protein L2735_00285 [Shewanella olleyana]|uniref:hypothetical protein n=1 Tax=Shewanella olleyana TaxID=135626 RepID=UPI00200EB01E|nr:hypothetical protein [Shewanella olleyana]MCL1065269.1 hypothetical protein [Shewanella olleyana]